MSKNARQLIAFGAAVLMLGLPVALTAQDSEPRDTENKIIIIDDDGESMTLDWQDQDLTITQEDGNRTEVTVIDVEEIGALVGDALEEVADVLADLQMDIHMGQDNRLNLSIDESTFELDMDEIFAQIGDVLDEGFSEFDSDEWTHVHDRDHRDSSSEELKDELDELRKEMRELRRELKKLRSNDD